VSAEKSRQEFAPHFARRHLSGVGPFVLHIPGMMIYAEGNSRTLDVQRYGRHRRQRDVVTAVLRTRISVRPPAGLFPCAVLIVRVAPESRVDDDNVVTGAKRIRDAIARWAGVDDGDRRWIWTVRREVGPVGVRIELHPGARPCRGCAGLGWVTREGHTCDE
jgi:hypothetical protein